MLRNQTVVYSGTDFCGWPKKIPEIIAFLEAKLAEIPEQHRANAWVEISSVSDHDYCHYPSMEIGFDHTSGREA